MHVQIRYPGSVGHIKEEKERRKSPVHGQCYWSTVSQLQHVTQQEQGSCYVGLFQRALWPLGALMCPLGLPQNQPIFNSHLNYLNLKTLLAPNVW